MTTHMVPIPGTPEEALDAIAALDVARWGEAEREPSRREHAHKTYGRLLVTLAHRPEYGYGDRVPHLVEAAEAALTPADRKALEP